MAHAHGLLSGLHLPVAPCAAGNRRPPTLRQHAGLFGQQRQQHRTEVQHHHTTPQVAAYPAFTDDNRPTGGGAVTATGPTELPQQQQQQHQEGQPDQQQRSSWFVQPPWGSNGQQQQQHQQEHPQLQWQQQQQQQQRSRLQDDVSAAMQLQQDQQQQQPPEQQPQSSGDAFIDQLQQCAEIGDVAALVRLQQQQEQEQLTLPQACAVLQQLCSVTRVATLTTRQQQQLQTCCCTVADTALRELPRLGHTEMGQLLAMYQVLGFKPEGAWVRSVLQHAGTELVHYTPAELSLLLLTATQASARCGVIPGPDTPVVQLQPSKRVSPTSSFDAFAAAVAAPSATPFTTSSSGARQQPFQQPLQQTPQQQQQRRANTVLTSAWLQHFLATFQPYIACRSAHPQLAPGHMEAVISCLAALRVAPDRFWMYLFVRQMSAQLPSCSPGSVVRMLGGLATLGYRLPDHVLLQVERQIGTAAAMVQLRAEECVEVVRSVAVLRAQQTKPSDAWLQGLLAAAVRGSRHLSASAVIGLLAATAALGLQLEPSWMDVLLLQARSALSAMTPHEHVTLLDALSQQQHQYRPGPVFMSVFLAQVATHLPELTISQQTVLATGLATVGYKPGPSWMSAFMAQLLSQPVTGADGDDLLQVLRALRRMQYVPAPNVAQQLSGLIDSIQLSVPYNVLLLLREALDELQYQRGIMALPMRQQQQAATASEGAPASSATQTAAVAGAEPMPPSAAAAASATYAAAADVVAIDGVVDPAAVVSAAAQQQAARDGSISSSSNGNSNSNISSGDEDATVYSRTVAASADAPPSTPAGDAIGDAAEPGTAAAGTSFTVAPAAAAPAAAEGEGSQQKPESGEQAEGNTSAGAGSKTTGVAQESLELFA